MTICWQHKEPSLARGSLGALSAQRGAAELSFPVPLFALVPDVSSSAPVQCSYSVLQSSVK